MLGIRIYKRFIHLFIVVILLSGLLVGCVSGVIPTDTPVAPSPLPTSTLTLPLPTPTNVPPTRTPTPTLIPTSTPMAQPWTPGQLEIHILDVKHGDAQLIISPTGETMLIDCGKPEYAPKIAQYLREVLGEVAVDYFMLSHYHWDHIGSAAILLRDEGLKVRHAVLDRGGDRNEWDSEYYRDYYDYVTDPAHGLKRVRVYPGDKIDMGPEITIEVLSVGDIDTRTACGAPVLGENDNSIALWLTFGKFDYWTAGDLSGEEHTPNNIEVAVIPLLPREVDVYRADHHGISANSNPHFLAALNPTVSLVSTSHDVVGWDCILRLERYGDVYITDRITLHEPSGDIVLTSRDGETYTVEGKIYKSK